MKSLKGITVSAKTFGSKILFPFELSSVSKTAISLHTFGSKRANCPFAKNSLIELYFEIENNEQPFYCMAKVLDVIHNKTEKELQPSHISPYIRKHEAMLEHDNKLRDKISLLTRAIDDPRYIDGWKTLFHQLTNIEYKHG